MGNIVSGLRESERSRVETFIRTNAHLFSATLPPDEVHRLMVRTLAQMNWIDRMPDATRAQFLNYLATYPSRGIDPSVMLAQAVEQNHSRSFPVHFPHEIARGLIADFAGGSTTWIIVDPTSGTGIPAQSYRRVRFLVLELIFHWQHTEQAGLFRQTGSWLIRGATMRCCFPRSDRGTTWSTSSRSRSGRQTRQTKCMTTCCPSSPPVSAKVCCPPVQQWCPCRG